MLGEKEDEGLLRVSEGELEKGRKKEAEAIRASMGTLLQASCFVSSALFFVITI